MIYGFRGRFLKYVLLLLAAVLLFSGVIVGSVMKKSVTKATLEKYTYANERISMLLEEQYQTSDALMKQCIANREFQNSLLSRDLTLTERQALEELLGYLNMDYLQNCLYVDNKGNVYGKPYQKMSYEEFLESGIIERLGDSYSETKWFVAEDTLFRPGSEGLFIGRYIRNMDFTHEPGVLLFKLEPEFFDSILGETSGDGRICMILDEAGTPVFARSFGKTMPPEKWQEETAKKLLPQIVAGKTEGIVNFKTAGAAIYRRNPGTGFYVVTFLNGRILNEAAIRAIGVMALIYAAAAVFACVLSVYFSKRFTDPIRQINDAMTGFDANGAEKPLALSTNTELDSIGNSYNKMSENIRQLLTEVREQERELYDSELNSLIYQINPHFLYNTLDTIYMLARINKEETTMKMIQALSRFLKVTLSKGRGVIPVEDELDHVRSYMDIQKIRNPNLFTYEIVCEEEIRQEEVLKLILQPLVENSIKHGFCDIYEGGEIRIRAAAEGDRIVFHIWNNGTPMDADTIERVQRMYDCGYKEMAGIFGDRDGGYGVSNVMGRLKLKYDTSMEYYYEIEDGGTLCVIKIPKEDRL